MGNVISIQAKREEREVEVHFAELLDKEASIEGSVKPLPRSMFDRIKVLREQAEVQRQEHDLIEC
ncbi:conserved hypothetical protein [Shewanella halifaxensis HAW-EB4]|uniref:Uncharacterized protein n=1 Tax=Shewanella halifaxensis (strain HAW-EB4) TaxID=458817 RepID=B0TV44_SHEHH|nr:hypothetical protein [Shewanella halifaxensis]ABZ78311.1 conserved hypothetical protein [Shewanella halifaxensis HAW-EB4]